LDQITPWNIDPQVIVDFLFLPESYFYPNALEKFGIHNNNNKETL
jgi:hypothetical protein